MAFRVRDAQHLWKKTQRVILHLKPCKVYECNALYVYVKFMNVLYCVPPILPEYKQSYLRVKKECIYEWTCVLSKKPLGQRAVAVRRRERGSFPNTQTDWSLLGFGPIRKAKPQSHLGITSFWSLSKTISFPCPITTSSSLFKNAAGQVKTRGNGFPSPLLKHRVCEQHSPTALWPTEGSWKREKQKHHCRMIWKHRAWATQVIHHNGAEDGITAKRNLV